MFHFFSQKKACVSSVTGQFVLWKNKRWIPCGHYLIALSHREQVKCTGRTRPFFDRPYAITLSYMLKRFDAG
ncbi:MAG: hypothetical protein OEU95_03875 [Nitrospirota bacterium]|nr:hypothetical protein [Nitrospirota bacterium]